MVADGKPDADTLLAHARRGNRDSLGRLLEVYRNYLHLLARIEIESHVQRRLNPSDIVQETFLHACRKFHQFRGNSQPELLAWLRSILVRNLARVVEREVLTQKRDVRREVSAEHYLAAFRRSSDSFEAALVSQCSSPSGQAQRREEVAFVADQLARLPDHYRDVILQRNLQGVPFPEIARRMGKSPGAVRSLWLRALKRLRQMQDTEDS